MKRFIVGKRLVAQVIGIAIFAVLLVGGGYFVHADALGPTVSELSPSSGDTVGSMSPQFRLRFYDPDLLDDTAVLIKVDEQTVTPVITWDGIYENFTDSCTGETYRVRIGDDRTKGAITAQFPQLNLGEHTVYYQLKDRQGNVTQQTYTFTIADTEGPAIVERSPAADATINSGFPTIKVRLNDANAIDARSIALTLDSSPVIASYDVLTKTLTYKHNEVLSNGIHSFSLTVQDEFSNSTSSTWQFTVSDTKGPVISGVTPGNNSMTASAAPLISASVTDLSGVLSPIKMLIDGTGLDADYNAQTGKVSYTPGQPLTEGRHTVGLTTKDYLGNTGTASWAFTIDQTGPALSNFSPAAASIVETLNPVLSMSFSDPAQLDTNVILKVDGINVPASITWDGIYRTETDSCTGETYQVRIGNDYTKGTVTGQCPKLAGGTHTLYYQVKDKLANIAEATYSFNIADTEGPQLVSTNPSAGSIIASGLPTISATLTDGNYIVASSVYMYLQGEVVNASYDASSRKVSYACTQPLLNGSYNVRVTAKDEMGNSSDLSWSFTVSDVTPPVFSNLMPANGTIVYSATPTIQVKITDPSGIKSPVHLQIGSTVHDIPYNSVTGIASYTPSSQLAPGDNTVKITAYDNQGQVSQVEWKFYVDTAGPELGVVQPVDRASVTTVNPKISMRFSDPSGIDAAKLEMLLDGIPVTPVITYDGIYENRYDSCTGEDYSVRIGTDYTKGEISYQSNNLANKMEHTVEMTIFDKAGNCRVANWSFIVHDTLPPEITSLLPAHGTKTENSLISISAKVADNNGVDPGKTSLFLNGEKVGSLNTNAGVLAYTPTIPYADDYYTVTATVYDLFGNVKNATWNFIVGHTGPPEITELLPAPGSGTRALRPTISAKVSDIRGIDVSRVSITLDGVPLTTGFTPDTLGSMLSGKVYAVPPASLSNAMHEVVLTVFDLSNNAAQKKWQFGVNQFGDMGVIEGNNCTTCHDEGIPAIEQRHVAVAYNCDLCHVYTVVGSEPDCCYCHDGAHDASWPPPVGNYACTECHNSGLADIISSHGAGNELATHDNTALPTECKNCHSQYLTREHNIYVEGMGVAYDCNTCHKSSNPTVTTAIASNNRQCGACHGAVGTTGHDQFHDLTLEVACVDCHIANISDEHLNNTKTRSEVLYCGTCHNSTEPKVTEAIANNDVTCKACHDAQDHETVHISGLDASCLKCHAANLTADHISNRPELGMNCDTCHNPDITGSAAIAPNNIPCASCHTAVHGVPSPGRLLADIPLYSEYQWSEPMDMKVWDKDTGLPPDLPAGGKTIMSNRNKTLTGDQVWSFYKAEMAADGWQLTSMEPEVGSHCFTVTFAKEKRKAIILFYGGESRTDAPEVASGHRVEVIYN